MVFWFLSFIHQVIGTSLCVSVQAMVPTKTWRTSRGRNHTVWRHRHLGCSYPVGTTARSDGTKESVGGHLATPIGNLWYLWISVCRSMVRLLHPPSIGRWHNCGQTWLDSHAPGEMYRAWYCPYHTFPQWNRWPRHNQGADNNWEANVSWQISPFLQRSSECMVGPIESHWWRHGEDRGIEAPLEVVIDLLLASESSRGDYVCPSLFYHLDWHYTRLNNPMSWEKPPLSPTNIRRWLFAWPTVNGH